MRSFRHRRVLDVLSGQWWSVVANSMRHRDRWKKHSPLLSAFGGPTMQMVPLFLVGSGGFGMDAQLSFGSDHASALCLPLMSLYSKGMAATGMVLLELRDFGWKFVITMLTTEKR